MTAPARPSAGRASEIGPAQIARERKCRGEDGAAIVRISFDDFTLPFGVEQIGESRRGILGLDQIGVVANWAERGECRRVHAIRTDLFGRQVLGRVLRQERRKQALAPPTDKMSSVRATHDVHFMDADVSFFADALEHALRPRSLHANLDSGILGFERLTQPFRYWNVHRRVERERTLLAGGLDHVRTQRG
jgi:hypothetical protein